MATPQMIEIMFEVERWFPLLGVGLTVSIVEDRESRRDKESLSRTEDREKCFYEHYNRDNIRDNSSSITKMGVSLKGCLH